MLRIFIFVFTVREQTHLSLRASVHFSSEQRRCFSSQTVAIKENFICMRWQCGGRHQLLSVHHKHIKKPQTLLSHFSPASQSAVLEFSCFCSSHPSLRVQICKLSPGGGYLCLTEGLRWLRRGARLISVVFQKGECVALLWKTAFVRLSCVRTEGENLTKEMALFKADTKLGAFFFIVPCCLFTGFNVHCSVFFLFSFHQPLSSTHSFTQTYFYFQCFS